MATISWLPSFAAKYLYRRAERYRSGGYLAAAHWYFARAARAGFAPAQHKLAHAYQTGQGCMRSGALAEHWYRWAATNNNIDAQFELGLILLNRRDLKWAAGSSSAWLTLRAESECSLAEALYPSAGVRDSDPQAAFQWLMKAAIGGKPEAQANVGWLLMIGSGCDKDREQAHRWLSAAADQDISQAALGLAEFYAHADAPEFNIVLSAKWAKCAAKLGNGSGSHRFGIALRDGVGVASNNAKAEYYFNLAADQGHPTAGFDMAGLVLARETSEEELHSTIERIRQCAKRNHIPSILLLAKLYSRGDHVPPDLREVANWYRLAADLGHLQAQFMMGCLFARGEGVVSDLKHAARYFELAAEGGHAQAAFNLGTFYLHGQGVDVSRHNAKRWLETAASAGLAQAQLRLGKILEQEAATPIEAASAKKMIEKAANAGDLEAKVSLARALFADGNYESERQAVDLLNEAMVAGNVEACELLLKKCADLDVQAVLQALQREIINGNVHAKIVLAEALLMHDRINRDPARALSLLKEGVEAENAQAYFITGVIYCQGNFVIKDLHFGYKNYLHAANRDHPVAQYNTGIMLLQGLGVEKNVEEAMAWIRRASGHNLPIALEFIRDVERRALLIHPNA